MLRGQEICQYPNITKNGVPKLALKGDDKQAIRLEGLKTSPETKHPSLHLAQLFSLEENEISHRGKALALSLLTNLIYSRTDDMPAGSQIGNERFIPSSSQHECDHSVVLLIFLELSTSALSIMLNFLLHFGFGLNEYLIMDKFLNVQDFALFCAYSFSHPFEITYHVFLFFKAL
ncbi:hypothetical protein ACJX0J_017506, partial [Zea mays]